MRSAFILLSSTCIKAAGLIYSDDQHQHKPKYSHASHSASLFPSPWGRRRGGGSLLWLQIISANQQANEHNALMFQNCMCVSFTENTSPVGLRFIIIQRYITHTLLVSIILTLKLVLNPPIYECKDENINLECNIKAFVEMHVKSQMQNKRLVKNKHIYIYSHLFQ